MSPVTRLRSSIGRRFNLVTDTSALSACVRQNESALSHIILYFSCNLIRDITERDLVVLIDTTPSGVRAESDRCRVFI